MILNIKLVYSGSQIVLSTLNGGSAVGPFSHRLLMMPNEIVEKRQKTV